MLAQGEEWFKLKQYPEAILGIPPGVSGVGYDTGSCGNLALWMGDW